MFPLKFASRIYYGDLTLQQAEENQEKVNILKTRLNDEYNPTRKEKIKEKDETLQPKNCFLSRKKLLEHLRQVFTRT